MEPRKDVRLAHGAKPEPNDPFPRRIAQDERLSPEALGLLAYLYSLPHTWEIWVSHIDKWGGWGRDVRRRIMGNLVDLGYLELVKGGTDKGSYYRMTPQMGLLMVTPDSDSLNFRPSPESDPLELRRSSIATVVNSGPIENTHFQEVKHIKETEPTGVGGSVSNVDFGFLGEDAKLAPRIRELLRMYPSDYEAMWREVIGKVGTPAKLALLYGSAGDMVRFAAAVAITEAKSKVRGRELAFAEQVVNLMRPAPKATPAHGVGIPAWIRNAMNTGYVGASAYAVLTTKYGYKEAQFVAMPPPPGSDEERYQIISAHDQ